MSACLTCDDAAVLLSTSGPPATGRLIQSPEIRLSEIIAALSVALDITQGHPEGHCMRTALIGMRIAEELRLPTAEGSALFYALLLKDLGCSSNAAKIAYLFGADDQRVKRTARMIDWTKPGQALTHCWTNCAPGGSMLEKLLKTAAIARLGKKGGQQIAEIRCQRGADIARMLQLPEATARAIYDLDEHWNGRGNPRGLKGEEISLLGRICCLAQTAEVFFSAYGLHAALDVVQHRRGEWFDPQLVSALLAVRQDADFWQRLKSGELVTELGRWEPDDAVLLADEACLDRVAEAFAKVVDAKSPWTYQHSTGVAEITVGVARQFGCSTELERDLRRAALLHDIGKLGVSNAILDKPGKPTEEEFVQIRRHPEYSQRVLEQVGAFQILAEVCGGHHERLDGNGYHRGLVGDQIPWVTRVLTVADICEAMSAKRPYRDAMCWEQIQQILARDAGTGVDADCLRALERWHDAEDLPSRVEAQLAEVDRLLAQR
ncbi:MAG TPA: HD domain-containing phosphohydrolase [Pirellulaceae bacterium]|nr:HD domain-containing phosphohydrolase [Pirellulaceae bacterium]